MSNNVLVVGGGAAGMLAAIAAGREGARVTLMERNEKLGKKLYITGKGRCNLTNDCDRDEFLLNVPGNPRFLYGALAAFQPRDMMALMDSAGCPTQVQRGKRVFPQSEKASDVIRALARLMEEAGVEVLLNRRVQSLLIRDGRAAGAGLPGGQAFSADSVILCCGGKSYPSTGSTGDGYRLAMEAGHTVTPLQPSLTALETQQEWPKKLQGLSLKNVSLSAWLGKRKAYGEIGEMLFTHFGVSGPLLLEMSSHLSDPPSRYRVELNLKPGLTPEQVAARLDREIAAAPKKQWQNLLPSLLPQKLCPVFPELCQVAGSKQGAQLTREERGRIGRALQCLPIALSAARPLEEAIVTRGGVSVKEVQAATMESKLLPGLYLAGELLDVDAHTGGFNLQIAFSTGYLAGQSAAREGARREKLIPAN